MSQLDPSVYRRRRLTALGVLVILIVAIWGVPQLFANQGQEVLPTAEETQTDEPTAEALTDCAPGVVTVEAMIGTLLSQDDQGVQELESLNSFVPNANIYIWYEIKNNGLVDCKFNVGPRVTFFTISSGDQVYWSSRDCDRAGLGDLFITLQSNETMVSVAGPWDAVYSSPAGCNADGNSPVPTNGATFKIKAEVNGVISDDKRFILN